MAETNSRITADEIQRRRLLIPIKSETPLLVHNFSEKARKELLDIFQNKKKKKQPKNPEAEYLNCLYKIDTNNWDKPRHNGENGIDKNLVADTGFSTNGFKKCLVGAARFFHNLKMTEMRQSVFIKGIDTKADSQNLVPIYGDHEIHESTVKVGVKQTDLRYRAIYPTWKAWLDITVVTSMIATDILPDLIDLAGASIGIGEWRPETSGTFGTFKVDPDRQMQEFDIQVQRYQIKKIVE